jgi:hypothetical protein
VTLIVAVACVAMTRDARGQTIAECVPTCGAGETCLDGVCMVPASKAPAATPAAAPPPEPALPPPAAPMATVAAPPPLPLAGARPAFVPPAASPLPDRVRSGALILPFLGLHSFQDSNDTGLDAGLRAGLLLGTFVNNDWSMNVGTSFDLLNPNSQAANLGLDVSGEMLDLTFSPLYHLGNVKGEIVIGPKLGGWVEWVQASGTDLATGTSATVNGTAEGWTLGGNLGAFLAASPDVLVGVLMSLEVRDLLHSCASGTGIAEMCKSSGDSAWILGFTFGLML